LPFGHKPNGTRLAQFRLGKKIEHKKIVSNYFSAFDFSAFSNPQPNGVEVLDDPSGLVPLGE
jgi:hypothetical protein